MKYLTGLQLLENGWLKLQENLWIFSWSQSFCDSWCVGAFSATGIW